MNYNRIKALLGEKGRTSNELAAFLGVFPQTVSSWCRNVNQPNLKTLYLIAEFLDIEAGEILRARKDLKSVKEKAKPKKKKPAKKG
jgi:putative transcriptional regulator